jgi:hypothetical protein
MPFLAVYRYYSQLYFLLGLLFALLSKNRLLTGVIKSAPVPIGLTSRTSGPWIFGKGGASVCPVSAQCLLSGKANITLSPILHYVESLVIVLHAFTCFSDGSPPTSMACHAVGREFVSRRNGSRQYAARPPLATG